MRRMSVILSLTVVLSTVALASNPPATLLGCWTVKRDMRAPGIVGLSQKEINRIVGTRVFYSESCAKSGRAVLASPGYETTTLSERDFFDYARVSFKQLGMPGPTITQVSLTGSQTLQTRFVGSRVFLGGKNPVIEVEGVFFELEKVKVENPKCTCVK